MIKMPWLLSLVFALVLTSPCFGQIAHDADSYSGVQTTDLSFSHTCTGANLLLKVDVHWLGSGADRTITAITYNGVAMTPVGAKLQWMTWENLQMFYLAGPATGANLVAVTFSGAVTYSSAGGTSLTGVDQGSPLDASNSATGTGTAPSVSVTTIADNAWIVDSMEAAGGWYAYSPDSPQVLSWDSSAEHYTFGGSYKGPISPGGATTMSWTLAQSHEWGIYAASFKPAAGGGAAKRRVTISD
jgi:hypothetical protein